MRLVAHVDDYADVLSKVLTSSIPHLKFTNHTVDMLHIYRNNDYLMSLVPMYEPGAGQGQYALTEFEIGDSLLITNSVENVTVPLTNRWIRNITITKQK